MGCRTSSSADRARLPFAGFTPFVGGLPGEHELRAHFISVTRNSRPSALAGGRYLKKRIARPELR